MNWDQVEGKWTELKGEIRQKWAKMTDSDHEKIGGKKDEFTGWLQKNYGYSKDQIEHAFDDFGHAREKNSDLSSSADNSKTSPDKIM
jgi:uncharacterized protein YjbJ (UPF0337 family)